MTTPDFQARSYVVSDYALWRAPRLRYPSACLGLVDCLCSMSHGDSWVKRLEISPPSSRPVCRGVMPIPPAHQQQQPTQTTNPHKGEGGRANSCTQCAPPLPLHRAQCGETFPLSSSHMKPHRFDSVCTSAQGVGTQLLAVRALCLSWCTHPVRHEGR